MKKQDKIIIVLLSVAIALLLAVFIVVVVVAASPKEEKSEEKAIANIALETRNAKSTFYIGEDFSAQGLGITVTYVDGTQELALPTDARCHVIAPDISKVGVEEVLVNFGNFTASYDINISRIDGLELDLSGIQLVYDVLEETEVEEEAVEQEGFSSNGLRVFLLTSSAVEGSYDLRGDKRELTISEYKISEPDLYTPGSKTVTVEYSKASVDCVATFEVCVTPNVDSMSKLYFNGVNGNELTMYINERSGGSSATEDGSASGWYLLRRADGTYGMYAMTVQYSALYRSSAYGGDSAVQTRLSQTELNVVNVTVDGYTFKMSLDGFNSVALGWPREVRGYELDYSQAKRAYTQGEPFSDAGLKVMVRYSDNNTQEASGTLTVLTQPDMNEVGVKTIEVQFTPASGSSQKFSYQIYCLPEVVGTNGILDFGYDHNGSGATLQLYITYRSATGGGWGTEQNVNGYLLVRNIDSTFEIYEFEYQLDSNVKSHPYPHGNPDGVWAEVREDGGNLVLYINGRTFVAADNDWWHLVVIGWQ